jgi:hypothetical protein
LDVSWWENPQSDWPYSGRQVKAFKCTSCWSFWAADYDQKPLSGGSKS